MNQTELHNRAIALYFDSLDEPHRILLEYCELAIETMVLKGEGSDFKIETCLNITCPSAFGRDALFMLGAEYYLKKAAVLGIKRIAFASVEESDVFDWCRQP